MSVCIAKAIAQYFHVVLFITLYNVVLTFKSVNKTLGCDHLKKSNWALLKFEDVCYAVQGGSNLLFLSFDETLVCVHSNKAI